MRGKIIGVAGGGTLYSILVYGEEGLFSIPVEYRYFWNIIEREGDILGREIEYRGEHIYFIDKKEG